MGTTETVMRMASPPDFDCALALVAGVYRMALRDARKGDLSATEFLDRTFAEWRSTGGLLCQNEEKS